MNVFKKILKVAGIVLLALLAVLVVALSVLHFVKYYIYVDYYCHSNAVSPLPSIHSGFVPQGLGYDAEGEMYLHSGYNGDAVQIYLVNSDKETKKVLPIYFGETEPAKGHGGGIAVVGDYVYLVDNAEEGDGKVGKVHIFLYADLLEAEDGDSVNAIGALSVDSSASFCFAGEDCLFVGEFYRPESYETDEAHHFVTPAGDQNNAILTAYPLNEDGSLKSESPVFAMSITDQVQGFAINSDGTIALSRSWGVNDSSLDFYDGWTDTGDTIELKDGTVPLYYLDSATHTKSVAMPAFSEGIALADDDTLLISFESACNKYVLGKFFFATNVVSYPVE